MPALGGPTSATGEDAAGAAAVLQAAQRNAPRFASRRTCGKTWSHDFAALDRQTGSPPGRAGDRSAGAMRLPRYAESFGTFDHVFPLVGVSAFMPPQGILGIAAYLPEHWQVRFVDENVRAVDDDDLRWAEVVFLPGCMCSGGESSS